MTTRHGLNSFGEQVVDAKMRGRASAAWIFAGCALAVCALAPAAAGAQTNHPPVANPDAASTNEDTAVTINVTANDSDADGQAVGLAVTTPILEFPAHGTAVRVSSTSITYTPAANYFGSDQFRYRITDGAGGLASAIVTLTVNSVNDAPVANPDSATTNENTVVSIAVTANDTDPDGDPVTLITSPIVAGPAHGTAVKLSGSTIQYTPATAFSGSDTFQYEAGDGRGARSRAWVTVSVVNVNYPPVANPDSAATNEDTTVTINVTANDSDPDGDVVSLAATTPILEAPLHGTAVKISSTSITYTPAANYFGADSFRYRIADGQGGLASAVVTLTVNSVNDPPVARDDAATTNAGSAVSVNVIANDTDVDGDAVTLITAPIIVPPANGTVVKLSGTNIQYTPNAGFAGSDSFQYEVGDNHGARSRAYVTVTVQNRPPVANPDAATTNEDAAVTINVTANDTDPDGQTVSLAVTTPILEPPLHGTAVKISATSITYTPASNYFGTDTFRYRIADGAGGLASAVVTITISGVNDAPVAVSDSASTPENTSVTINVTANDTDMDGDPLTLIASPIVVAPAHGTALRVSGNSIQYMPNLSFSGSDTFQYEVGDNHGARSRAWVTVSVAAVNDPPSAQPDVATTDEDTQVAIVVTANDTDPDGDPVRLAQTAVIEPALHGTTVRTSDTTITYVPAANWNGSDQFRYRITDGNGLVDSALVTVTIAAVNDAPVAADDVASTEPERPVMIHVVGNDSDVDGDAVTLIGDPIVTQPLHGTATKVSGGDIRYTPAAGYTGADAFQYEVGDGHGGRARAFVRLTIMSVLPLRVAVSDGTNVPHGGLYAMPETGVSQSISRLFTITNLGGQTITLANPTALVSGAGFSQIEDPADATLPANGGSRSFRVRLLHSQPGTYQGVVTIAGTDPNFLPFTFGLTGTVGVQDFVLTASPGSRTVAQGQTASYTISVAGRFRFATPVALSLSGLPAGSSLDWNPDTVVPDGTSALRVFTTASTPVGTHNLTLSASGGGITHTLPLTLRAEAPAAANFGLEIAPDTATVVRGGSVQYVLALVAESGFTGTAALSVAGLPAGAAYTLDRQSLGAGDTATLSVTTSPDTPDGTSEITVTATAGGLTRSAMAQLVVRLPQAPGEPVIDSVSPELFDGGGTNTVTLTGHNFQNASVTVAEDEPDPDDPTPRRFPVVRSLTVNEAGTRIDVQLDSSDAQVMDFYNLVVDNGVGRASSRAFRIVPAGPLIDMVSPNQPERGDDLIYVMSIAGHHLRNASVRAEPAGVLEIHGVDAADDNINALLTVPDNAPLGPVDLVVTDPQGRQARIQIEVFASGASRAATRLIQTQRVDPTSLRALSGASPTLRFQEFAVRDPKATEITKEGIRISRSIRASEFSARPRSQKAASFIIGIYVSYTVNLFNFHWERAFVFDPETGRIGDAILQGLGLGQRVRFGAFVLSFALRVDLSIEIYITNTGFTWPRFCIRITAAAQIPGWDGFYEQWNYCRGGGWVPFNTGSTSSLNASGGQCGEVTQEGPPIDGLAFAEVEQRGCCNQPIEVAGEGTVFGGSGFAHSFAVTTPNAGTTTPSAQCQCSFTVQPACVLKGDTQRYTATAVAPGGTYSWRIAQGSSHATLEGPIDTSSVSVRGSSTSGAADDVTLEVTYTNGQAACVATTKLSVVDVAPLQFTISGDADRENSVRSNFPYTGLPRLGPVRPGDPQAPASRGFHKNMQLMAQITPCDPALSCKFDFDRLRYGTAAQVSPAGVTTFTPTDCHNSVLGCPDDGALNDEDKTVDASTCAVYSLDTPGWAGNTTSWTCPSSAQGTVFVQCLNFTEWLMVDGKRSKDYDWNAATRIRCVNGSFDYDNALVGNQLGSGWRDCSTQAVIPYP